MARVFKIFISHSWDHLDDLNGLREKLSERGYFNVVFEEFSPNSPINSQNIYYMRRRVLERIQESDIVIGLAGIYASYSEWMKWELDAAKSEGKPILGVAPWGQEKVSRIVAERADKIVRWNTESIVSAIRDLV